LTCLKVERLKAEGLMGCQFDPVQGKGRPLYMSPVGLCLYSRQKLDPIIFVNRPCPYPPLEGIRKRGLSHHRDGVGRGS